MHRLFFALWPDPMLCHRVGEEAEVQRILDAGGGCAVRLERYHMTLQFLGDFDSVTTAIFDALEAVATSFAPPPLFELQLDRIASFDAARVTWLGCRFLPVELIQLHGRLGDALRTARVPVKAESGFVPHVTLRRNARARVDATIEPLHWQVRDFVLVDSSAGGYRIRGRWPLALG